MRYKIAEIREHFNDFMEEFIKYNGVWAMVEADPMDLHHECFNMDYYIIGRYQATEWMGSEAFHIIDFVKQYELDNWGEVSTDFSEPEQVVNHAR